MSILRHGLGAARLDVGVKDLRNGFCFLKGLSNLELINLLFLITTF